MRVNLDGLEEHLNEIIQDERGEECYTKAKNVMTLVQLIRENQKDVQMYKNLYEAALKEAKQQYEWRKEDSECGHCEIKEGLDMLEYRIQNSAIKENKND